MSDRISFGVGCFHFGVQKPPIFTLKGRDYVDELGRVLESISNVDKVRIEANENFQEIEFEANEEFTPITEGLNFFPPPACHLDIEFEIYIPKRIQNELSPLRLPLNLNSERFKVYIRYPYFFPVAFVEVISPAEDCNPSDAIVIVREFLNRHFEETRSELLRFEYLGPSPFHGDFYLQAGNGDEEDGFDANGFILEQTRQRGYDVFEFFYDPALYESLNAGTTSLFFYLESEVSLFYRITHRNVLQMKEWEGLQEKVDDLLERQRPKGLKEIWSGLWGNYRRIHEIVISIAEFESGQIWMEHFSKREYRGLVERGRQPYVDVHLMEEIQSSPNYPSRQIRDLVELLEERRSKTVENAIIIISAVLGGIAGSIITLILTKP